MKTIIDIVLERVTKLEETWNKTFDETIKNQNEYIRKYNKILRMKINTLYLLNLIVLTINLIILWR